MKEQPTRRPSLPRFDACLTAAENRRDDWQRVHGLAQAWAAADPGNGGARDALAAEARELLARLEPLESCWAFPGPVLMRKLRDKFAGGDAGGCAELARRLAKAVLGGTYRRDESLWTGGADDGAADEKSRAPSYAGDGKPERLYFEVLVVG